MWMPDIGKTVLVKHFLLILLLGKCSTIFFEKKREKWAGSMFSFRNVLFGTNAQ